MAGPPGGARGPRHRGGVLTSLIVLLAVVAAAVVLTVAFVGWAATLVHLAAVPDTAWRAAHADRRTWTLALVLGGPSAALVFWLATWPQLRAAGAGSDTPVPAPVAAPAPSGTSSDATVPGELEPSTPATKAPARTAPATKAPARKAPARRAPAKDQPS